MNLNSGKVRQELQYVAYYLFHEVHRAHARPILLRAKGLVPTFWFETAPP